MVARARVGLQASLQEVSLSAGAKADIKLTITNGGYVVDAFDLTVRGIDSSWYALDPQRVSLFPNDSVTTMLRLRLPPRLSAGAGEYKLQVVATSRDNPAESAVVPILLRIVAAGELAIELEPQRVTARRGAFRLALNNDGNKERPVVLRPSDPEERLLFSFGPAKVAALSDYVEQRRGANAGSSDDAAPPAVAEGRAAGEVEFQSSSLDTEWTAPGPEAPQGHLDFTIPPSSRVELPMTVLPKKRIWRGAQAVPLAFEVAVTPPGVEWEQRDVRRVRGELVYRPILARWSRLPLVLRRVLMIGIPLLIVALILFQLARSQEDAQRQQAAAQATAAAQMTAQAIALQTRLAQGPAAQTAAAQTALAGGAAGARTATALADMARNAANAATQTAQANATSIARQTAQAEEAAGGAKIVSFAFTSGADGAPQVTWEVTATNRLTVTLNGTPVPPSGSQSLDTSTNQSLVLVGSAEGSQPVSRTIGTLLIQPPDVVSFVAEPAQTCSGCEVTLTWNTARAEKVAVDGTPVTPADTGSIKVRPAVTTEYVMTAENALGRTERVIIVTVVP